MGEEAGAASCQLSWPRSERSRLFSFSSQLTRKWMKKTAFGHASFSPPPPSLAPSQARPGTGASCQVAHSQRPQP